MTISVTEDICSLAHFEAQPQALAKQARQTGRPIVITNRGKADLVIMDAATFERQLKVANLSRLLLDAEADVRAGRTRQPGNSSQSVAVAKKYLVEITSTAEADILGIHSYIARDNAGAADRWVTQVERLILKLERHPFANEVIPEAGQLGVDYRHKLFKNYRIIYRVEDQRVVVLRVFHSARLLDQGHLP